MLITASESRWTRLGVTLETSTSKSEPLGEERESKRKPVTQDILRPLYAEKQNQANAFASKVKRGAMSVK